MLCFGALLVFLGYGQLIKAQKLEAGEMAEDCLADQFFNLNEVRCQNCSEVMRLFEGANGQEEIWPTSGEATTVTTIITTNNNNNNNNNNNKNNNKPNEDKALHLARLGQRLPQLGGSTRKNQSGAQATGANRPLGQQQQQANTILSRLVLKSNDELHEFEGPASSSSDKMYDNFDETNELTDQAANLAAMTKQWLKLLNRFVQSNELFQLDVLTAIKQCKQSLNTTSCQLWSNVCVLTMYANSAEATGRRYASPPTSQASSTRLGSLQERSRSTATSSTLADQIETRTSWQKCPKFALTSICNSLRNWHQSAKPQVELAELADIYADDEELVGRGDRAPTSSSTKIHANSALTLKPGQPLQLLAYKRTLDGRLLEVSQLSLTDMSKFCLTFKAHDDDDRTRVNENLNLFLDTNYLQLDEASLIEFVDTLRVGQNMHLKCRFSALEANLFAPNNLNETLFVDLFVAHSSPATGAMFLKPVPVVLKNVLFNHQLVNLKFAQDSSRWKLVHRFFFQATLKLNSASRALHDDHDDLHDRLNNNNNNYNNDDSAYDEMLVYTKSSNLELTFRRQHDKSLMVDSILLHLEYAYLPLIRPKLHQQLKGFNASKAESDLFLSKMTSLEQLKKSMYESEVGLTQELIDMLMFKRDFDLFVTILCLVSCIWSLIKCYSIQKYQGSIKLDVYSLLLFIIIGFDVIANLILLASLAFGLYLLIGTKLYWPSILEKQVLLAPNSQLESIFLLNLQLALVFKLVGLAYKLYTQLRSDIFFIDWERPKMLTSTQILNHNYTNRSSRQEQLQTSDKSKQSAVRLGSQPQQQISFWRQYSVINRWLQMQTIRRQHLTLQLIIFGLLIEVAQLEQYTSADSNWHHLTSGFKYEKIAPNQSQIFRTVMISAIYLTISLAQVAYQKCLHEPLIRSQVREFLDLCSVANVSVFSMLYPRLGFYIHGRNANGSSECSIGEINALLEREERELCSKRGLVPETDHQTFVLFLPKIVNDHYRKLLFRTIEPHDSIVEMPLLSAGALWNASGTSSLMTDLSSDLNGEKSRHFKTTPSLTNGQRSFIESVVARNRAVNVFLINYLEHVYKDIDYRVKERRRFEALFMDIEPHQTNDNLPVTLASKLERASAGGPLRALNRGGGFFGPQADSSHTAALGTFFVDSGDSFTSLIWLGLEWDFVVAELLVILNLDCWLGSSRILVTLGAVWLSNCLLRYLYSTCARNNLIVKSMLDEKFLVR